MSWELYQGDCIEVMQGMPEGFVQTCVTSPPYYGLRDYGVEGQIGLEESPIRGEPWEKRWEQERAKRGLGPDDTIRRLREMTGRARGTA